VVEVLRWMITETWCNETQSKRAGSPVLLVPKVCFWVTNITQRGHIYWSQNNLVYIATWLWDSLQRMSSCYAGGFWHGDIIQASEPPKERKVGLGLIISYQAIKSFSGVN